MVERYMAHILLELCSRKFNATCLTAHQPEENCHEISADPLCFGESVRKRHGPYAIDSNGATRCRARWLPLRTGDIFGARLSLIDRYSFVMTINKRPMDESLRHVLS
jgi:hypothetical protein